MQVIEAPKFCPSCEAPLVWETHILFCKNPFCGSQKQKKVLHFAKTLKIKGLGPSTIEKLGITDIDEIYSLSLEEISSLLDSQKLAEKLKAEIDNSRNAPLNMVLPAFSIPLIGQSATDKLSKLLTNISEINDNTCKLAGLGPTSTTNLIHWLRNNFLSFYDGSLPFDFNFVKPETQTLSKGIVCISGKLKSFKTKADATKALENAGYLVKSSLTKQVEILVNESGVESSKTQSARASGITIVTNLTDFLEK